MTDKHMDRSNAGREVGERRLVPVGETPVVLPVRFPQDRGGFGIAATANCKRP